jgi:hypothetical protein
MLGAMSKRIARIASLAAPALVVAALAGGCSHRSPAPPAEATRAPVAERLELPGARVPIYVYPETIVTYPAGDRGAYVLELDAGVAADVRARLTSRAADDVLGDAGVVMRLADDERAALTATAGVRSVRPLQPSERHPPGVDPRTAADSAMLAVRIDLFADASADEVDALVAWIAAQGGDTTWRAATALTATLPPESIVLAARLSPVRWVE